LGPLFQKSAVPQGLKNRRIVADLDRSGRQAGTSGLPESGRKPYRRLWGVRPTLRRNVMRRSILAATAAVTLLTAPAALAAPTCQDRNGDTIKCGIPGAMPVGWTLSPQQRWERQRSKPADSNMNELLELICIMGVFFALMALLPQFDGWSDGDWHRKGDDE
jgi:hypothetical protein